MIRDLFEVYRDAATRDKLDLFPIGFAEMIREDKNNTPAERWAADFISGLTEQEVHRLHRRLVAPSA